MAVQLPSRVSSRYLASFLVRCSAFRNWRTSIKDGDDSMRILVTGSQGTLGRPLVCELRHRGHDVFGCDLRHSEDSQEIRADVAEYRQLRRCFFNADIDLVYHLAAEFGRNNGQEFPEQLWRTNQIGTRNIIDLCLKHKARLILAGSSEAYGDGLTQGDGQLFEGMLEREVGTFHNEYALSKWAQERQVFIAANNDGLRSVVLRFFNAFGEGEFYTPYRSVVCLFCYRLMFGLPVTVYRNYHRVFMHVDDMMRTLANAAERFDNLPEKVYNVGGTEYRSVEELAAIISSKVQSNFSITWADKETANVTNKRPDVSLAVRDLGHDPKITLEEGVMRTISWMREVYDENGQLRRNRYAETAHTG